MEIAHEQRNAPITLQAKSKDYFFGRAGSFQYGR
jgi:hypothetical protein